MYFVGRLGSTDQLAAVALASTFINISTVSVAYGMASALDTLASQLAGSAPTESKSEPDSIPLKTAPIKSDSNSYNADICTSLPDDEFVAEYLQDDTGQHHQQEEHIQNELGTLLQRSIYILLLSCIPIIVTLNVSDKLLMHLFRQPPAVAHLAGVYARLFSIAVPPFFIWECMKRYLQALNYVHAPFFVTSIMAIVNWVAHWLLCRETMLGFYGAPVAAVLAHASTPVMGIMYMWWVGCLRFAFGSFRKQAWREWMPFL
jgi:Na+-driven multidrug efflux pump